MPQPGGQAALLHQAPRCSVGSSVGSATATGRLADAAQAIYALLQYTLPDRLACAALCYGPAVGVDAAQPSRVGLEVMLRCWGPSQAEIVQVMRLIAAALLLCVRVPGQP